MAHPRGGPWRGKGRGAGRVNPADVDGGAGTLLPLLPFACALDSLRLGPCASPLLAGPPIGRSRCREALGCTVDQAMHPLWGPRYFTTTKHGVLPSLRLPFIWYSSTVAQQGMDGVPPTCRQLTLPPSLIGCRPSLDRFSVYQCLEHARALCNPQERNCGCPGPCSWKVVCGWPRGASGAPGVRPSCCPASL